MQSSGVAAGHEPDSSKRVVMLEKVIACHISILSKSSSWTLLTSRGREDETLRNPTRLCYDQADSVLLIARFNLLSSSRSMLECSLPSATREPLPAIDSDTAA